MKRFFPRSIRGRLLLAGVLFAAVALVIAAFSIGEIQERFVRRGLDERLDAQIALLARSVRDDGTVDTAMLQEIGPFTLHRRGWGWRIEAPGRQYSSREVVRLENLKYEWPRSRDPRYANRPQPARTPDLYVRSFEKQTRGGVVRITAAAPRYLFLRLRHAAIMPMLGLIAVLSLALLLAMLLQLHVGLKPLKRLRVALAEVRGGTRARIGADQPAELAPVVAELNALLDANEAALTRARGHVSNLAHSLKTPLATLSVRLAEPGHDPDGQLGALVAQIDGAIRHHLGRARAASPGAPGQPLVPVGTTIDDLLQALGRIYAEKNIRAETDLPAELTVKCDPQDLSEMLGNLLDNAWKWGRAHIVVGAVEEGRFARITIDDDGAGLTPDAIAKALVPGQRLDEREEGHGFGLPIARELAELHGGSLELGASPLGGLRASLLLPR